MKRNTTLTVILMTCSIAAAVAAPELPADLAGIACADSPRLATTAVAVETRRDDRMAVDLIRSAPRHARPAAGCEADVTEPYRRLHHGSFKLDPVCRGRAET